MKQLTTRIHTYYILVYVLVKVHPVNLTNDTSYENVHRLVWEKENGQYTVGIYTKRYKISM